VGVVWPLEAQLTREFATGLQEILVVEEKRQVIEYQLKEELYNWRADVRPNVWASSTTWAKATPVANGRWPTPRPTPCCAPTPTCRRADRAAIAQRLKRWRARRHAPRAWTRAWP
jgi:hypothetical protein